MTLEESVDNQSIEILLETARDYAEKTVKRQNLSKISYELRPHDTIYWPDGEGPFLPFCSFMDVAVEAFIMNKNGLNALTT